MISPKQRPHQLGLSLRQGKPLEDLHPLVREKILHPLHLRTDLFPLLG